MQEGASGNLKKELRSAFRYAVARYGPDSALGRKSPADGRGYDVGGFLPGVTMVHNNTGAPEKVIPLDEDGREIV